MSALDTDIRDLLTSSPDLIMSQLPTGISARYWSTWHTQLSKPVAESLEGGEAWIGSWSSVGLYEK